MKKQQNNSTKAWALQVALSVALLSISAVLLASSFNSTQGQANKPLTSEDNHNDCDHHHHGNDCNTATPIKHVIVLIGENWTFDSIFGTYQPEYGTGSSRDWAAKGTKLLGVRAVIAESFERIHRSNLVGMGVLPLQFLAEGWKRLGLTGEEIVTIRDLADIHPRRQLMVELYRPSDGKIARFPVRCRIDTATELEYFRHGGVLNFVLRNLAKEAA